MPLFYDDRPNPNIDDKTKTEEKSGKVKYPNVILVLALFFFSLSCGIESIFQSQSFTFALCGPHNLSPKQACSFLQMQLQSWSSLLHVRINSPHPQAASLTTTLCVSFLSGRFSGIFLSTRFTPKVMVVATNLGFVTIIFSQPFSMFPHSCPLSSLLLASTAGWVLESLYIGTAIMGFSISMQVASGFAWLADQVGVSGSLS